MSDKHHGNPVATYIITALILGVITYVEFAIVEYEIAWLSRAATIFWLVALSVIKFVMVVAIFMHLKDDEKTYTGFFGSGMIIALATFIILPLLFTVSSFPSQTPVAAPIQPRAEVAEEQGAEAEAEVAEGDDHAEPAEDLDAETRELIESDGYNRSAAELFDTPRPMDRSLQLEPPAAAEPEASLAEAPDAEAEQAAEEEPAEAAAEEDEPVAAQQAAEQEEAAAQPEQPEQQAAVDFDRELGQTTYSSVCAGCHGPQGGGTPSVFPPLAGNLPQIYNAGGREYLMDVVLHGLSGPIEVNGQTYNGAMPPWAGSLSNEQVAAVLNHSLTAWGNDEDLEEFDPITPDEVAPNRDEDPGNLNERRAELLGQ